MPHGIYILMSEFIRFYLLEMQIKNYSEIPLHTSQNGHQNQINKKQVLARLWRKGNPSILLVGMQTTAATVENRREFPQTLLIEMILLK